MDPQTIQQIATACTAAMRPAPWLYIGLWSILALALAALLWHHVLGSDRR